MVKPTKLATFKVHQVKDGPYQDEEEGLWWLLCWVEDCDPVDGEDVMFDEEIPFSTMTNAYNFKTHFDKSIDPILIEFNVGMEVKYDG